jgi:hypothetical protein
VTYFPHRLTEWEREFPRPLPLQRSLLSEKQQRLIHQLYLKVSR